ncbi:uncharacterized protein LOC144094841 isoform X1 [Amblyomma americanum]
MATARYLSGFGCIVDWRPLQFVEHLPDIRICGLCGVVARMTMLLPCSHIICQTCYRLVLDTYLSCPVDKRKVGEDEVQTLELKGDQLDDRRVLCLKAQRGCSFMGKLVDFKVVLHESIATSQLAKVHLPSAADSEGRGRSPGGSGTVDRVYVCLGQIYKRKSSLCTGMTARELTPAFNLAGYSTMLESKFEMNDGHISLALGVVFCSGGWDSFVTWPFSRQVTLTLVHPVDKQKNLSYQASVPEDVDRFECVKKPSPEGPNSAIRTRMISWNALELSGFIANDSLCVSVEFE